MSLFPGRQVFIRIDLNNVGGSGANWVKIGQQRGGGISRTSDKVDATHKDDNGWPSAVVTRTPWSITCDGVLDPTDPAWHKLYTTWRNKTSIWVKVDRSEIGGKSEEGQVLIDDLSEEFPEPDLVSFTADMSGNGPLNDSTTA